MRLRSAAVAGLILPLALSQLSCDSDQPAVPTPTVPGTPSQNPPPAQTPTSNRPPTVEIADVQPAGLALVGGTQVTFGAKGSDPDGDSLSYDWDFGDILVTNAGAGVSHVFEREGEITVTVTARDGRNGQATAKTVVRTGKLSGDWVVANARHLNITASISHRNGANFSGTMSDGATFSGSVSDPRRVTLRLSAANGLCIPSGTYHGDADTDLAKVVFSGVNCKGFQLIRQ